MTVRKPETLKVFARGASLRRRVAYSLALVRLILVPVILLAIYYLFAMSWIVDGIVSVDAPVATLAQRASLEMLEARRAERDYLLLHDHADLTANREALWRLEQIIGPCADLQPVERTTVDQLRKRLGIYRDRFQRIVAHMGEPAGPPVARIREVVRTYERDLNEVLRHAKTYRRGQLLEELRSRVGSFDAQITSTLEPEDPEVRQSTLEMRAAGDEILKLTADLEKRSWERVERNHERTRALVRRAEWMLIVVSALTLVLSIWVSFILPRAVVKPLMDLKAAVDHAAAGNYEIEFDVQGDREVVQLANSVRNLIAHVREKKNDSNPT